MLDIDVPPGAALHGRSERHFLTLFACARQSRFAERRVVEPVRSLLLRMAPIKGFAIPAYCFVPDRLVVLAEALRADADVGQLVSALKQESARQFARTSSHRLWQDGYDRRLLRADEETLAVAVDVLQLPVAAGIAATFDEYPFSGTDRFSTIEIREQARRASARPAVTDRGF